MTTMTLKKVVSLSDAALLDSEPALSSLLICNEPPSDTEAVRIAAHISRSEHYVQALKQQIAEIPSNVSPTTATSPSTNNLFGLLRSHNNNILSYRRTLHVSRCIPTEILEEIFKHLSDAAQWIPGDKSQKWAVSQVCQRWRQLSLRMPQLWTDLPRISLHNRNNKAYVTMLTELLARSGEEMLRICTFADQVLLDKYGLDMNISEVLYSCQARWQVIHCEKPQSCKDIDSIVAMTQVTSENIQRGTFVTTNIDDQVSSTRGTRMVLRAPLSEGVYTFDQMYQHPEALLEGPSKVRMTIVFGSTSETPWNIPLIPYRPCTVQDIVESLELSGRHDIRVCSYHQTMPVQHLYPQLTKLVSLNAYSHNKTTTKGADIQPLIAYFIAPELRRLKIDALDHDAEITWKALISTLNESARPCELSNSIELQTEIREMSLRMSLKKMKNEDEQLGHLFSLTPNLTKLEIEDPSRLALARMAPSRITEENLLTLENRVLYHLPHLKVMVIWISPDAIGDIFQDSPKFNALSYYLGPHLATLSHFRFLGIRFKDFIQTEEARRSIMHHLNSTNPAEERKWLKDEQRLLDWGLTMESEVERLGFRLGHVKTELNFLNPHNTLPVPSKGIAEVLWKIMHWEPLENRREAIYISKLPLTLQTLCSWEDMKDPNILQIQGLASIILEKWEVWFEEDANCIEWVPYGQDGVAYLPKTHIAFRSLFQPLDIIYGLDEKVVNEYIDWDWKN